jgi:hypothetical protein
MNLLRGPILRLRCSPYGCTAALLDTTSARSRRFLHALSVPVGTAEAARHPAALTAAI